MKHGRTLQELAMELDRQARTKKDYLIDTSLLSMRLEDDAPVLHFPADELLHSGILHINDIAHRQIGQSLGIPAKYYDKMRTENPDLLVATSIAGLIQHLRRAWCVRSMTPPGRFSLTDTAV